MGDRFVSSSRLLAVLGGAVICVALPSPANAEPAVPSPVVPTDVADDCTCGVMGAAEAAAREATELLSVPAEDSFAAAVARATADELLTSEETVGDAALSLPGDALSSDVFVMDAVPTPERVLWCEDANDPRCSQDASQPEASQLSFPSPTLVVTAEQNDPRLGAVENGWRSHLGDAAGVRRDLDRPPRG